MKDNLQSLLGKVNQKLENASLFYLSNDPEKSIGLEKRLINFHPVFIDDSQFIEYFKLNGLKHFSLKENNTAEVFRSSVKLIKSPEFLNYFNTNKRAVNYIQTFKISSPFAFQVEQLKAYSLNTSAQLNRTFEDKITQYQSISKLGIQLPKTVIGVFGELIYSDLVRQFGERFVVQFERGHTGSGTIFINNKDEFENIKKEFPARHVRVSEFLEGREYTINACVGKNGVYIGGLSVQITGIEGLAAFRGATIGNDWSYRQDFVNGIEGLLDDVKKIGDDMRINGYKGLFGVDLIVLPTGAHRIIEINARQPASIPMYTKIQLLSEQIPLSLIHLAEFMGIEYDIDVNEYNLTNTRPQYYSQVFLRPLDNFVIQTEIKMGIYSLKGDSIDNNATINNESKGNAIFLDEEKDKALSYVSSGFTINDIKNEGILLMTQKKGLLIKMNGELSRIQLSQSALDATGVLKPWIKEVLLAIKDHQR